jgi:hypothetical protein
VEDVVERWPSIRSRVHDILHRLPSRREVDDGGGSPDTNIRRLGHLAAEITKSGGIAICASIAPYARLREDVRAKPPDDAEIVLDATYGTPEDAARRIIDYLDAQGYLEPTRG